MARGVVHIQWYATLFRADQFVDAVSDTAAPTALRYDATRYSVQRSLDDHYKILQQIWFEDKDDWYRYWEGVEMREFRARYSGKYQIPITYVWHEEHAADGIAVQKLTPADLDPELKPSSAFQL
ncbi:MAG: hypothetical protein ACRDKL_06150 [Solirubrobacteraceae bacterium]